MMDNLKLWLLFHVIWIPCLIYKWIDNANHPEQWEAWYDNPVNSILFCVVWDVLIFAMIFGAMYRRYRYEKRLQESIRLMKNAELLWSQGRNQEAQWCWEEGLRLGQEE
jgi:hypothetical protein